MPKFCPRCGKSMSGHAKFCMSCGKKLEDFKGGNPIRNKPKGELKICGTCQGKGMILNPNDVFHIEWIPCPRKCNSGYIRV